MPLATTDIIFRTAAVQSDAAGNGGRMGATALADNVKNALFPDVRQAERLAGSERWRKVFIHFAPADLSQALDVRVIPYDPTPAGDSVVMYLGTQTDTQSAITGALPARAYGVALLSGSASAGVTALTVALEAGAPAIFAAGDTVYITDKATIGAATGAEEYATVATAAAPSGGTQAVTLTAPLANSYGSGARLASVVLAGDVLPTLSGQAVVGAAGVFTPSAVTLYPRSTVADTWTLTFTSASAFTASGAVTGAVGSGTVGGSFGPNNASLGGSYFTLGAGALGGTWAAGDTVTFTTAPAAIPLWLRRAVPANTLTY
ncbi:MAG: hypothetical protein U1E02_11410, partial [Hydrogenophaga sp.]|nr:hypothetical protein [Hydrogenophaga sp.]